MGLHRQSVNQPLQIINQTVPNRVTLNQASQQATGFWLSSSQLPNGSFITINNQTPNCTAFNQPKPPAQPLQKAQTAASLRSRPLSSQGFNKRDTIETNAVSNVKINSFIKGFSNDTNLQQSRINSETYRQEESNNENGRLLQLERDLKFQLEKEIKLLFANSCGY